jgi:hypothetical protein
MCAASDDLVLELGPSVGCGGQSELRDWKSCVLPNPTRQTGMVGFVFLGYGAESRLEHGLATEVA